MDLRQLRAVVAVVDEGGFTRAATALHVAQPSLSQTVAGLERELGVDLFHRTGRRVVLTAAGEALLEPARQALRAADTARAAASAVAGLEGGHLDLVCLPTLAADPLAPHVGAFRAAHPRVTVRLLEPDDPTSLLALVRSGACELGVTEHHPVDDDLERAPLMTQAYLVVLPTDAGVGAGPLAMADVLALPLVTTPVGTSNRRVLDDACAAVDGTPRVAVETTSREALVPLVLAGAGATLLPGPLALDAERRGATVRPVDPPVTRAVGTVHRRARLSPAATTFLTLVQTSRTEST
jgi:LysR family transcriptional regulator, carnitine catabolism transcriptional activator